MESWFSYRLATILAISFLLVSSVQFYKTMDHNGQQWNVRLVAESYARQINTIIIMEDDVEAIIEFPDNIDTDSTLTLSHSTVRYESNGDAWSSNLVRSVHLWDDNGSIPDQEHIEQKDAKITTIIIDGPLFLEVKNLKIDGITTREAFVHVREGI